MTQGPRLRTQAPDRHPHVTVIARSLFRLSYLPEQFVLIPTALLATNRQQQPAPQQPRMHQDYLTPSSALPLRQYDLGIFPVQCTTLVQQILQVLPSYFPRPSLRMTKPDAPSSGPTPTNRSCRLPSTWYTDIYDPVAHRQPGTIPLFSP